MNLLLAFLAISVCAIADRMRGDKRGFGKLPELFAYGAAVWFLVGGSFVSFDAVAFCALWSLGASFGWGGVVGPILYGRKAGDTGEWWQVGPFLENLWLAAVARGALWGAPGLLLLSIEPRVVFPFIAVTVAFPLALFVGRLIPERNYYLGALMVARGRWAAQEIVRGALVGFICYGLFFIS